MAEIIVPGRVVRQESFERSFYQYTRASMEFSENFAEHVLYNDDDIVVINKPYGIPVTDTQEYPTGVVNIVRSAINPDASPVHKLDKDTSGALIFGMTKKARRVLSNQFLRREVDKEYLALVDGEWNYKIAGIIGPILEGQVGRVEISEKAKKAATSFDQIGLFRDKKGGYKSLLMVKIFTGRTHQIRAHLRELGFPITGDHIYNPDSSDCHRQLLHAYRIKFRHPTTNEQMLIEAPIARDFERYVEDNLRPLFVIQP